jgi:PAS domain S-box-containing protein
MKTKELKNQKSGPLGTHSPIIANNSTLSTSYMENVFHSMNVSVIVINPDRTIKTVNKATLNLLGYQEKELVGQPIEKIFAKEFPIREFEAILLGKEISVTNTETTCLTKGGNLIPISLSYSLMQDENDYIQGIVCVAMDISNQKKAEMRLRESEERFRALFELASDAILTVQLSEEKELYFVDCNSRTLEMFDCKREEFLGKTFGDFSPEMQPDGAPSREKAAEICSAVMEGTPSFFEWTFCRYDGTTFPAEVSLKRIDVRDKSYIQAIIRDITERKWMEDAFIESEEYARSFIESSQDCVCNISIDGKFMSMNPTGCILNDIENPEEIIGTSCTANIVENKEAVEEAIKRAAKGENVSVQFKTISKKGKEVWWDAKFTPVVDLDGSIKSILKVSRDITDYKKMEKSLLHTQEMLLKDHKELSELFKQVERAKKEWENTVDCVGDMIILTDKEGRIRRFNNALLQFTQSSRADIIGKTWEDLMTEHDLETVTFYADSIELLHKPTHRWFTLNSYPFKDSNLELSGAVITVHETTEMKKITEELEKAYQELKATQAQILQREKMASIGQLAAGVAHEINNPMGFITSNLGTLGKYLSKITEFINVQTKTLEDRKAKDILEELKEIRKKLKIDFILEDIGQLIEESLEGAERVKKIVQNLKTFSRVDEAEFKFADINECIESTLNIVWNELKYKATLKKEYEQLPLTKCYPQQLNQVFMNLLVNAAHAIEKQGEIKIKTWNGDGFINVSISDTGCGIPPDKINRIFEPFFTTKEIGKGTGLGLSISYDIIKKHNGEILVESEVGKGTTFTVRIPVVEG